ncbi:uncharacterized protein LOC112692268 [Sipha flava]|uniref:Uncharacterized protein LOC112692268 n=1 Tax=Sipha flava TaxID=143950 RepID=A0A8B8GIC3_9HEMI|nr:uncharacterized protein LOC112692268 [Sipha flava]
MNNTPKITTFFTAIRSTESTCSSETPSETAETLNLKSSIDEDGEQSLNKKLNSQNVQSLMVFNTYISSNRRQQFTTVTYETLQNVKNLEPSWKGFAAKNKTREDRSNNGQRTTYGTRSETVVCLVTTKQNESRTHEVLTMGRSANSNNVLERRAMTNVLVKWRRTHVIRLGDGTGTADRR